MRVMKFNNLNSERIMKTIADLRKEFKQQHKIDAQQFTRHANERTYSLDYVHWLEDIVLRQANGQSTGSGQSNIPDVSVSSLLEETANLVGNPGTNISGSCDIACMEWQEKYERWRNKH